MEKNRGTHIIGLAASKAYAQIVGYLSEIESVSFARYSIPPFIAERASLSLNERQIVDAALAKRVDNWFSYLEIILEMAIKSNTPVTGIMRAVSYHQPHPQERIHLSRKEIASGMIEELCAQKEHQPFAIYSRVKLRSGLYRHVPLLDLHLERTEQSTRVAFEVAERLTSAPFVLLETTHSYHLAVADLLSYDQLVRFFGSSLLYSPIVDNAFIAHQLIEGESSLRVSGRDGAAAPKVIASKGI